jgi:hypothetical protein
MTRKRNASERQRSAGQRRANRPLNPHRLRAFARDCVLHGDMTPTAERMLHKILDETRRPNECPVCAQRSIGETAHSEHIEAARARQLVSAGITGDLDTLKSIGRQLGACPDCKLRFDGLILRLCAGAFVAAFGSEAAAADVLGKPIFEEDIAHEIAEIRDLPATDEKPGRR